ncbi:lipid A deacylase LpxR family protein [Xanthomonas bonasiae]|uniref:lipid A deacylase LpxR family protein n=1 Tax=Xanthomonas bonasiae TaxID=2810351 RepID=UPI00177F521F|nr:lipid A deacylase LpxR family protein [Xanthomonas surreyensis]MBD7922946.1 lipid A deacylase LpxR family protein [Xanthomonas surreyensis]
MCSERAPRSAHALDRRRQRGGSCWLWLAAALAVPDPAAAQACATPAAQRRPALFDLRLDNDFLGLAQQDQGYTNGAVASVVLPDLVGAAADPCRARVARWLNARTEQWFPGRFTRQQLTVSLGQGLFTPTDGKRADPILDDRPYAAVAMLGLGYNLGDARSLRSTQLRIGMVGPSARGREVQDAVHGVFGLQRFQGWDRQLRDRPVLQLVHERLQRWPGSAPGDGWGWDGVGHVGASVGNFARYANAGFEWRWGRRLPDDFGSDPLRPAGGHSAMAAAVWAARPWAWHLFVGIDARWMAHDLTLQGQSGQRIDPRLWVGDLAAGAVLRRGRWQATLAQYRRTREFDQQREPAVFGSLSISRAF